MIHVIDLHFQQSNETIAAFLVETSEGPVLIETGPHSTFNHLQKGIEKAGFALEDIKHVFLSHIHFDHAGAAWALAEKGAKIYVEGKLQTRKWQGQDGQDRYTTEVVVSEIQMMDSRNPAQAGGQQFQQNAAAAPQQNAQPQQSWGNQPQQAPAQQAAPQMAPAYQQQAAPQQAPKPQPQKPQQAPAQYNEPSMDFDDDIPF